MTICAACAPPGGGRNAVTPRFVRHFSMFCIPAPSEHSLKHMFTVSPGFHFAHPLHCHFLFSPSSPSFLYYICLWPLSFPQLSCTVEPVLKDHPITNLATKMWSVKTGGIWLQVQLYWNVGPSAKKCVVFQDRWSHGSGLSGQFHCTCFSFSQYHTLFSHFLLLSFLFVLFLDVLRFLINLLSSYSSFPWISGLFLTFSSLFSHWSNSSCSSIVLSIYYLISFSWSLPRPSWSLLQSFLSFHTFFSHFLLLPFLFDLSLYVFQFLIDLSPVLFLLNLLGLKIESLFLINLLLWSLQISWSPQSPLLCWSLPPHRYSETCLERPPYWP